MADAPVLNRKGTLWAAFVGVNDYDDPNWGQLSYSSNDASALAALFQDPQRGWHSMGKTRLLVQPAAERHLYPTRSNILATVGDLAHVAKEEDVILFGFFGHGLAVGEESFLLPSDGMLDHPVETAIRLAWVEEALRRSNARIKVLIVDACHSGMLRDSRAGDGKMTPGMARTLHELGKSEGWVVLSSCKQDELSYDYAEQKHGVFSYFLLEGLRGAADSDCDGLITMSEVSRFVASETSSWAFARRRRQTPELRCNVAGADIVLLATPPTPSLSRLSDLTLPEELYLLCANDSTGDTGFSYFCKQEDGALGRFATQAAAIAELVLANRLTLQVEEPKHKDANASAWVEVINRTPLGDPILDAALESLTAAGSMLPPVDLLVVVDRSWDGHRFLRLEQLFGQTKERWKLVIRRLTAKRILDEKTTQKFFSLFSATSYPIREIEQQRELRRKFSVAMTAGAPFSTRVAVLALIVDSCGYSLMAFAEGIKKWQEMAAIELAEKNDLARLIQRMVGNAISISKINEMDEGGNTAT